MPENPVGVGHEPQPADVVARAQAALEGVTEGPWETEPSKYVSGWYVFPRGGATVLHAVDSEGLASPDFRFLAAARSLIPELVAEIERLRGVNPNHEESK